MKHDVLRSVGHNVAASLASGDGQLIGMYEIDVFGDARRSCSSITVDFLNGAVTEGNPSAYLSRAVRLYRQALPALCERHGASIADFRSMTARYSITTTAAYFVLAITDSNGRKSRAEYAGFDGQRVKEIDSEGRLRPKPIRRSV